MVNRRAKVDWVDATCDRPGWSVRYTNAGGRLRSIPSPRDLERLLGPCWMARTAAPAPKLEPRLHHAAHVVRTVLQRGLAPPIHPDAERALLSIAKVDFETSDPGAGTGSMVVEADRDVRISFDAEVSVLRSRAQNGNCIESSLSLDSNAERDALAQIVRSAPGAATWLLPQSPLGSMASAGGGSGGVGERVDFLLAVPGEAPRVIEIDGAQHVATKMPDAVRDALLASIGYAETLRIPASDVNRWIEVVAEMLDPPTPSSPACMPDPLVWGPAQTHRLVLALLESLVAGFVGGETWHVEVVDPTGLSLRAIRPYLDLFAAADVIAGGATGAAPETILFTVGDQTAQFTRSGQRGYSLNDTNRRDAEPDVTIRLECFSTPIAELPQPTGRPEVVVRSTGVPVPLRSERFFGPPVENSAHTSEPGDEEWALTVMLQSVFAKESFREGQLEAIREVLAGRDCMVLLPTGAGKSIVYQLATMCRPGCAVVVDPLVALMDDQVDVMRGHGIERVEAISSQMDSEAVEGALDRVQSGEQLFLLVTPERFRSEKFRDNLLTMSAQTPVNVAVVDEAHCVSEWGHDFRAAYLDLGRTIRRVCRGMASSPPPILALTGTASRAVLMDVLHQLEISIEDERTVIKPKSFDRPEIELDVVSCPPSQTKAALSGLIQAMPAKFGESPTSFFSLRGPKTASGLVFCPTKTGWDWSTEATHGVLSGLVGAPTERYAGGLGINGKRIAGSFKANEVLVLATTSAYGMGIDKPNIRWIVHNGLPGSIEAFYQQAGRAARDRRPGKCVLLLTEYSRSRNDELMQEDDLDLVRMRFGTLRGAKDNVTTALFFHLQSFAGAQDELESVLQLVDVLAPGDIDDERTIPVPASDHEQAAQDRALLRLRSLGLVNDVVRSGNELTIQLCASTPERVVDHLVRHVDRSQPGQADVVHARMTQPYDKLSEAIEACADELIRFIYATVERSRRRSLREMLLAARAAVDGADLRTRILEYLTEGDVGLALERLVDSRHKSESPWIELWDQIVTANDARELRAASGRLLESYPDDPFLRMSRALAELLLEDGDIKEAENDLVASQQAAAGPYGLDRLTVRDVMQYLTRRCAPHEKEFVVLSAVAAVDRVDDLWFAVDSTIPTSASNPALCVLRLRTQLESKLRDAQAMTDHLQEAQP